MLFLSGRERGYVRQYLNQVCHTTFDPTEPGVVRIHLVPPKETALQRVPYLVILNGQDIVPITLSWAILLSAFMRALNPYDGREVPKDAYDAVIRQAAADVQKVYPRVKEEQLKNDLYRMLTAFERIAHGEKPGEDVGAVSIFQYAKHMRAPHRMDLMISAMTDAKGAWHCNQRCVHCYAAGQKLSGTKELTTQEWLHVIDKCREACIAQLTFTGGEPTLRADLPELVEHARYFITRLNTNGILLTKELCEKLAKASLDSVQVTLYSTDADIHNRLVGAEHFADTINGIKTALQAGLNVSVNTPLCALNTDYVKTLSALKAMGVRYFSCSGLIKTGGACTKASEDLALSREELSAVLKTAFAFCKENGIELQFTSPGCVSEEELRKMGATMIPSCGAALSNMAVAPDGEVIPCQSWLKEGLGSLLTQSFEAIWNGKRCREIREVSSHAEQLCQLKRGEGENS